MKPASARLRAKPIEPVNWVRSRQEGRELDYWLALAGYNRRDRSLHNRLYLLYLVVFFSAWGWMTLALFGSMLENLLAWLNPAEPTQAAVQLALVVLGGWSLRSLWNACRRSPLVFSEDDAGLICQAPVSRRRVTLRWLPMPWIKSAIPFLAGAVALGLALAGTPDPGIAGLKYLIGTALAGLRAGAVALPIHLALFALVWTVGVYRLQQDGPGNRPVWLAVAAGLLGFCLLAFASVNAGEGGLSGLMLLPFQAAFGVSSLGLALLAGGAACLAALWLLARLSGRFSLTLAAQETGELAAIDSAIHYGFTSYAEDLQAKRRLRVGRPASAFLIRPGAAALISKDLLQSLRAFQWIALFRWCTIFAAMFSLPLLPEPGSRVLVFILWADQLAKVSTVRFRNDLGLWPLVRQIPTAPRKLILADSGRPVLMGLIISLAGLLAHAIGSGVPLHPLAAALPGVTAAIAGIAMWDIARRARITLLLSGSVPDVSAGGVLLGLGFAAVPAAAGFFIPGTAGSILIILSSLLAGWTALLLASQAYTHIGDP